MSVPSGVKNSPKILFREIGVLHIDWWVFCCTMSLQTFGDIFISVISAATMFILVKTTPEVKEQYALHRQDCPEITYIAMGFRPHSFPVGGMNWAVDESYKKSLASLLKRKECFTNPSCLPQWERKTSPRSTALGNRIDLQPFLRTR